MLWQLFGNHRPKKSTNRPARRRSLRLAVEALEDRWLPSTFTWVGPSGGDFNTAANWQDQTNNPGVPGVNDNATIGGGVTVMVTQSQTVNALTSTSGGVFDIVSGGAVAMNNLGKNSDLSNFVLENGGTLQVNGGTTILDGGTLAGTVDVAAAGTLDFSSNTTTLNTGVSLADTGQYVVAGATVTLNTDVTAPANFTLQNGTINGSSNLTIPTGTTFNWVTNGSGQATMGGGGATTVQSGATLNIGGSNTRNLDTRTLNNSGTINVTGAADFNLNNGAPLHNLADGTINLQSDFNMGHGFTTTGTLLNDGTLLKTSAVNGATGLDVTLTNTATGIVHVQSGQLTVTHSGTNAGTFTADSGAAMNFSGFLTYTFNTGAQFTGSGLFDILSGNITVAINGDVSVSNLQLDSGTINGTGTLRPTAFTWNSGTLVVPTVIPASGTLDIASGGGKNLNGSLTNNGTVNVTSTTNVGLGNTPTITNNGTFNLKSDKDLSGNALFLNAGTLTKSSVAGTGPSAFGPALNNSGTVDVQSGVLQLGGGGNSSGAWIAENGGTLAFNGGTMTLSNGSTFSGAGLLTQSGTFSTLNITGSVTAATFTIAAGNLQGSGTFTVTGTLDWTGGNINNANGIVSIPVGATLLLEGNADKSFSGGTLNLAGTTTWKDSGNFNLGGSGTINNLAGATFTIQNGQTLGGGHFNNAGALIKSDTGMTKVSTFITFINTGTIDVQAGDLNFAGSWVQNAGATTIETGATLEVGSFIGGSLSLNGGTLSGTGTLSGDLNNAGTVLPGSASAAGTLSVTGKYTQTAGGTLAINVGGTTPGSGFSQLAVGGSATLAGTLSLNAINGFTAALGNTFTVVTFQSASGGFVIGGTLAPGSGNHFSTTLGATSFTVAVALTARAIGAAVEIRQVGPTPTRFVKVFFADNGALKIRFRSPFQSPAFSRIRAVAFDSSGDGVADAVLLTARRVTNNQLVGRIFHF
jgi:hypothetical protein